MKRKMKVLIAEDDPTLRAFLVELMAEQGCVATAFGDGASAIKELESKSFDLAFCDVRLPGAGGIDVLRKARDYSPNTQFVLMTAYATIEMAVEAMKIGASDFLQKPFTAELVVGLMGRLAQKRRLMNDIEALERSMPKRSIVGSSASMQRLLALVEKVARSDAGVLVMGESGVGKELVAAEIHARSERAMRRFVPVNIPSIPDTMVEAELFGHEKGAFTGAVRERAGLLEIADGGTLFLDEVGDLSPNIQTKMLRFIQEKTYRRLGSNDESEVDVRIIGATNRDLAVEVEKGNFREDLYYRLNIVPLRVPALREHIEDLPELVSYFISVYAKKMKSSVVSVAPQVMEVYMKYSWPGNVRELENVIARALALESGEVLLNPHLESVVEAKNGHRMSIAAGGLNLAEYVAEIEKDAIQYALNLENGVRQKAADRLGLKRTTLIEKMRRFGMEG